MDNAFDNLQSQVSLLADDFERVKIEVAEARSRLCKLENRVQEDTNVRG